MEYRTLSQFVRHRFQMTFYCSCNDFIIFHDKMRYIDLVSATQPLLFAFFS